MVMTQEIIIAIFLAILTIPLAVWGATMPKSHNKVSPIVAAISVMTILALLLLYLNSKITPAYLLLGAAIAATISVFVSVAFSFLYRYDSIKRIIKEITVFHVQIGNTELDAATILMKNQDEFALGIPRLELIGLIGKKFGLGNAGIELFNASDSVFAHLVKCRLINVDLIKKDYLRGSDIIPYYRLSPLGTDVVEYLKRKNRVEATR